MKGLSKLFFAAALVAAPAVVMADDAPADPAGGGGGDASGGAAAPAGGAAAPAAGGDAAAGGMYTKETWPKDYNARPLTLAKGMIEINGDVFINLSADNVAKPIAIAPDIYYGVSDKLSVGLTHGLGLCLTGTSSGCAKVYNDVGVDAKFSVKRDAKMDVNFRGGLDLVSLDPMTARLHVGIQFKYTAGKIGVYVDPTIGIGLNKRDGATDPVTGITVGGNKEGIGLPVKLAYQASPELNVWVRTGLGGFGGSADPAGGQAPFSHLGDLYGIPLGVGALFAASNKLDVGGEFFFPAIAGATNIGSTDNRALLLKVNYRL